jgi:hypothetical protein
VISTRVRLSPFSRTLASASTTGMPSTTRPGVCLLSSDDALPRQMKKDVWALAGSSPRAIDRMPPRAVSG